MAVESVKQGMAITPEIVCNIHRLTKGQIDTIQMVQIEHDFGRNQYTGHVRKVCKVNKRVYSRQVGYKCVMVY